MQQVPRRARMLVGGAASVLLLLLPAATASALIVLDFGQPPGRPFEGLGALSGGGGTSRLLYDYQEPQRSDVLDTLFGSGALQIFKTEIGGDAQSTEATEPSHMHTRGDENYNRGYEWWLMVEAKKRNPAVKLYALSWGAPGWIGNGSFFSDDNLAYHVKWLQGAKKVHGLDIDFMGIWNEHSASSDWIVQLRRAMDGAGFESTAIVATDEGGWPICDVMLANQTIRDAVAVIGSHYPEQGTFTGVGKRFPQAAPTPASCQALNEQHNKSLWTSEGWNLAYVNDWAGGLNLASTINRNYVLQNQTAMVVWNLIYSWYSILPFAHPDARDPVAGMGHGLMTAAEPWSGHYKLQPPLYAMMHTTQFTEPGTCRYLDNEATATNGWLDPTNASTIVVFDCGSFITIVVETSGLNQSLTDVTLQFKQLPPRLATAAATSFDVWRTCENDMFRKMASVPVDGQHSIKATFLPRCIYTLASTSARRGSPIPAKKIPGSASFPNIWVDSFDSYTDQQTVKYFTDESGSFNAAKPPAQNTGAGGGGGATARVTPGMVLQQAVPNKPIQGAWWGNSEPFTLLGNSQNWTDITVEVDAMIMPPSGGHMPLPVPTDGYAPLSGALLAGNDLGNESMTWDEAVSHCNATTTCVGFTFAGGAVEPQPTKPVKCYFKHSTASDADADWFSWIRETGGGGGGGGGDGDVCVCRVCVWVGVTLPASAVPAISSTEMILHPPENNSGAPHSSSYRWAARVA